MTKADVSRHNNIAISLHWLMALLIVGMLVVGKLMVQLDDTNPLRFALTQWHKTFGILILLLAVFRIVWRLTHRSPPHPKGAPKWELFAANFSHIVLYSLLFIAPITGWMLVTVSPLNIDTLLFNLIPWPHLPWLAELVDKTSAEARFHQFHEIATGALIALLILHIAAALKHHIIDNDTVMSGMLPSREAHTGRTMFGMIAAIVLGCGAAIVGYSAMNGAGQNLQAGNSAVQAMAMVTGESTNIVFTESSVSASISSSSPESSTLQATVTTASATSPNLQVQGSLPEADWFDSATHPQATFDSTSMSLISDNTYSISGTLIIKGIKQPQQFEMLVSEDNGQKMAKGEFIIDRTAYQLGLESQPNEDYVGNDVTIQFQFNLSQ